MKQTRKIDYDEAAVAAMDYGGFAPAPMAAAGTSMTSAKAQSESTGTEQQSETADDLNPEKIIYSGDATIETTEFDGTLGALENLIESCGFSENDAINMATFIPAQTVGLDDRLGSISEGMEANLTVLDSEYNCRLTVCHGEILYRG